MRSLKWIIDMTWFAMWLYLFAHFTYWMYKLGGWQHYVCEGYALFCLAVLTFIWLRVREK